MYICASHILNKTALKLMKKIYVKHYFHTASQYKINAVWPH